MSPNPVIVRTLDLGGRKLAREVLHTEEDNPVLGLRGIRLTMARPEIFRIQLRGSVPGRRPRTAVDHAADGHDRGRDP